MKFIQVGIFFLFSTLGNLHADEATDYESKTLIQKTAFFDGIYYHEKDSATKYEYDGFFGQSENLKELLAKFPESNKYQSQIDDRLFWGNIIFWGSTAIIPADIALMSNYGNAMPMSTAISVYLGIAGVAILGEIFGGDILNEAKNLTDEAVWQYNKMVVFGSK